MNSTRTVLVQSATRKCSIDFKPRGTLGQRSIKLINGQPSIRLGATWHPVSVPSNDHAPVRLTVARTFQVPGLRPF